MSTLTSSATALTTIRSGLAVAVQVRHRDRIGAFSGRVSHDRGPERAVAVAQADGHVPGTRNWVDQVGDAVAGQVGDGNRGRAGEARAAGWRRRSRARETCRCLLPGDPDRVGGVVVDDQVGDAVAIDISDRDATGRVPVGMTI